MKVLNIIIKPNGKVSIDAEGYTDAGCKADTAPILDALTGGEAPASVEDKPEASIPASTNATNVGGY